MKRQALALGLVVAALSAACKEAPPPAPVAPPIAPVAVEKPAAPAEPVASSEIDPARLNAFAALPANFAGSVELTGAKVNLGRMLFHEARLSKNHDVSCNSCHTLTNYGVDGQPTSTGHKGQKGGRNSPTVYNAAGHFVQFWDGRAPDVEAQAKGPVTNPVEMALANGDAAVKVLTSMPEYVRAFKTVFPKDKKPITFDNMAAAIAAFERTLVTPSRFDKFLGGDKAALTAEEKQGFNTFVDLGCTACHNGALVGGAMYQKLGLVKPWEDTSDTGRFAQTKAEADKMFFKVPSLRNIEKTAPYFHSGKVASLEEAVKLMGQHQLGKTLTDTQVKLVVGFLKTLTGDLPAADHIKAPALPKSTKNTPRPDPA